MGTKNHPHFYTVFLAALLFFHLPAHSAEWVKPVPSSSEFYITYPDAQIMFAGKEVDSYDYDIHSSLAEAAHRNARFLLEDKANKYSFNYPKLSFDNKNLLRQLYAECKRAALDTMSLTLKVEEAKLIYRFDGTSANEQALRLLERQKEQTRNNYLGTRDELLGRFDQSIQTGELPPNDRMNEFKTLVRYQQILNVLESGDLEKLKQFAYTLVGQKMLYGTF